MSDDTYTTTTHTTFDGSVQLVRESITNGLAAADPRDLGDNAAFVMVPPGHTFHHVDLRAYEDFPRQRNGTLRFVGVTSFAAYVNRYKDVDTIAYAIDVTDAPALLRAARPGIVVVFDDHPTTSELLAGGAANRVHRAVLELTPTVAAQRWGSALDRWIDQETLLDLVVDGAGEIASPDAAVLRDLAANLHAIRSVEVESVIRTGGEGTISVTENVHLRSGVASQLTFPETIDVTFAPFTRATTVVAFRVKVKAAVRDRHVQFQLTGPGLADQLIEVIDDRAAAVATATDLVPMWRPDATNI